MAQTSRVCFVEVSLTFINNKKTEMLHPNSRLKFPNYHTPTAKSHTINTLIICSDLITSTAPAAKVHQHQTTLTVFHKYSPTPRHQLCDCSQKSASGIPWYRMKKDTRRPTALAIIWYDKDGYTISTDNGDDTNSCKRDCAMTADEMKR